MVVRISSRNGVRRDGRLTISQPRIIKRIRAIESRTFNPLVIRHTHTPNCIPQAQDLDRHSSRAVSINSPQILDKVVKRRPVVRGDIPRPSFPHHPQIPFLEQPKPKHQIGQNTRSECAPGKPKEEDLVTVFVVVGQELIGVKDVIVDP